MLVRGDAYYRGSIWIDSPVHSFGLYAFGHRDDGDAIVLLGGEIGRLVCLGFFCRGLDVCSSCACWPRGRYY